MAERPDITPELKVGALLQHYPEVEETLIALSPEFRRLKNPVLRATVAKIASLRQVAQVGGVSLGLLITTLRRAAGVEEASCDGDPGLNSDPARPEWARNPARTLDAREMIENGGHPLPQVLSGLMALENGQVFLLVTPFVPSPLVGVAEERGFQAWSETVRPGEVHTWFVRQTPI